MKNLNFMEAELYLVKLYRLLANAKFDAKQDIFSGHCVLNEQVLEIINFVNKNFPNAVYSTEVDGTIVSHESLNISHYTKEIFITILLPRKIFFNNANEYIKEKDLEANGSLGFFYLVDEDYVAGDDDSPDLIEKLNNINDVIEFLSDVLPHSHRGTNLITFVYFPEDKSGNAKSKREFNSEFEREDLDADLTSFNKLRATINQEDCHKPERITVFRNSLAELFATNIGNSQDTFSFLLNNFEELYEIYKDNYDTYINGFSLEKVKKEITDYHEQFSKSLSDGMNEIVSKSLAIPASIAAGALLMRLEGVTGDLFMLVVLALTAVITSMLLSWQKINIKDNERLIKNAFISFVDDPKLTERARIFSNQTMDNLLTKVKGAKARVNVMFVIVWLPALTAASLLFVKYDLETIFLSYINVLETYLKQFLE